MSLRSVLAVVLCGAVIAAACGSDDDAASPDEASTTVTVFAAASLTDAFPEIGEAFEAANDGVTVEFNFAGSSALREQILAGAPADVFASANASNLDTVVAEDLADEPRTFATNALIIAVPAGNPAGITALDDFADASLLLGLCAEQVPCGSFARDALAAAGVEPSLDTEEPDVRALLTKIEAGELDAGIVYVTDVTATDGRVDAVDIPADVNIVAAYPIATLTESADPDVAAAFVAFVTGPEGQRILASYGFAAP